MSSLTPLDGLSASAAPVPRPAVAPAVKRWKGLLLFLLIVVYVFYTLWSAILIGLTPSTDPLLRDLPLLGLLVAVVVGLAFLGIGALMIQRIAASPAGPRERMVALAKVAFGVVPALLLSVATPLLTLRTLPITIRIVSPEDLTQLVAPISMTFSVDHALAGLAADNFVPTTYRWDINADRKVDQETSVPELTATFEREGSYVVTVQMVSQQGTQKTATGRFVIRKSVFKITPPDPIVNEAAIFSFAHLYAPQGAVQQVEWDFNDDGTVDETSPSLEMTRTFFQVGNVTVRALVKLTNNTQALYERVVTVREAPELPFPVTLETSPKNLIGSPPFPVLFTITTPENVAKIEWDFGDGDKGEGAKIAHTFEDKGSFPVNVRVHSQSGVTANLLTTVRMVDVLRLGDLTFEGTPELSIGGRIEGEVPLSLDLTPKTATPFIEFTWEAPGATEVGSTETTLQAIYRREGDYTITLIAQDLEDHVLRMPISVTVEPASSALTIAMSPETGTAPLLVKFDASESFIPGETITGFIWQYGDGSQEEIGGASAQHTYLTAGTFSITLSARTTSGKLYTAKKTLVVREPLLRACITPSRIRGEAPLGVNFTSACTVGSPGTFLWDFGDGAQSDQKDVIHVFEEPGTYSVKLTVTEGQSSHETTVTITVLPPA